MLSNCVSHLFCCSDIARCSPNLSIMSLPSMFIVLMSTSSIVQFFAIDDPHGRPFGFDVHLDCALYVTLVVVEKSEFSD